LSCVYCQNCDISQRSTGREVTPEELAGLMLALQEEGCHNLNFVSPSHVVAQILEALEIAVPQGLRLPLVYNTGGYDSLEALKLLDGMIDIYMPDMKYGGAGEGLRFSKVPDYPEVNRAAVREMHRQVGDLELDGQGIARRGLLVRHLVLPGGLARSESVFKFLADEISRSTYLNIMDQYHPCHLTDEYPELHRRLSRQEYTATLELARSFGLTRLD
jgi:putative pyruvate formate lyase activating enzyme